MAYGGELASAFVRIRPNLTGFRETAAAGVKGALSEVQAEVRSAARANVAAADESITANRKVAASFEGIGAAAAATKEETNALRSSMMDLGKVVGIAFGAEIAVHFVKDLVSSAASVQKQTEVIKSAFGSASEAVLAFSEKGAAALGISAKTAETSAARFGLLFHNLKIGQQQASDMTVNLLKLAGSISAIRGIDPGKVLQTLPLALAGNVRGLKQLGFAFSQQQFQAEAFKLHLTAAINQGLTPAQKAVAIYTLVTQHLADFQKQAASHSGDLANASRRLSAEWQNATEALGGKLLPVMARFVGFLADKIPGAMKYVGRAFGDFAQTVRGIAHFVGPALRPVLDMFERIRTAFSAGGTTGIAQIRKEFSSLGPVAKAAAVGVAALGAALVVALAAAFPVTATIAAVFGLGVALAEAYKHSARFREIVGQVQTYLTDRLVPALKELAARAAPVFALIEKTAVKAFGDIEVVVRQVVRFLEAVWARFGGTIKTVLKNDLHAAVRVFVDFTKNVGLAFDLLKDIFTGKWSAAWKALKELIKNDLDAVKTLIVTWGSDIGAIFQGIWKQIQVQALGALEALVKIASAIIGKITGALSVFGFLGGPKISNPLAGVADSIAAEITGIKTAAASKSLADAAAKNAAAALRAKTNDPRLTAAAGEVGKTVAKKMKDAAETAAATGASTATTTGIDAGVRNAQAQLSTLQQKLKQLLASNAVAFDNAVRDAKANLITIGQSLASSIGQIIDQPFTVAQQKIQSAQDKLSLIYDTKNARLQAQASRLGRLQSQLSLLSDTRNLALLRGEVALPGGRALSTDPKKALSELNELAKGANAMTKPAVDQFILQYQQALVQVKTEKLGLKQSALDARHQAQSTRLQLRSDALAVAQDISTRMKILAEREIADLTANLSRGAITLKQFNKKLASILAADHVSYRKAGALLGDAFALGFRAQVHGIAAQAGAIAAAPSRPGSGLEPKIDRPDLLYIRQGLAVQRAQNAIASKQLAIQKKEKTIAEKQAKTLDLIHSTQTGGSKTSHGKNPGSASHHARALSSTTG